MRTAAIGLATAGALVLAAIASPGPAEARGGFWRGGFGPGLAGGFIAGAVIGGLASSAYAWGPAYGYYGGYAPAYYGYGPAYYPYGPAYYAPGYYPRRCPQPGYGEYYNCGGYAVPGYGGW
jgi:hypothetical protein